MKAHTLESLIAYKETGRPVGGFLSAVLHGDLFEAVGRADDESLADLADIVKWVYNNIPMQARHMQERCFGGPRCSVQKWTMGRGLAGFEAATGLRPHSLVAVDAPSVDPEEGE